MSGGGKILIQQRSKKKEKNAGLWDMTASGHVNAGESPIGSLLREVKEEVGLDISEEELKLLGKYWRHEVHRDDFIENELDYIYILDRIVPIEDIKLQEEEVEDIRWVSKNQFETMLENGEIVRREVWKDLLKIL